MLIVARMALRAPSHGNYGILAYKGRAELLVSTRRFKEYNPYLTVLGFLVVLGVGPAVGFGG